MSAGREPTSLALLEIGHLSPALVVADRCVKAAGVALLGIENTDAGTLCLRLRGGAGEVQHATQVGAELARKMGTSAVVAVLPGPHPEAADWIDRPPVFSPLLGVYDGFVSRKPCHSADSTEVNMSEAHRAIGLLETQGLVVILQATDVMLKTSDVSVLGKEKIGGGFVTIMVGGDLAAVQAAVEAGKMKVQQLGGKLIHADVISNPHPDLTSLLPPGK